SYGIQFDEVRHVLYGRIRQHDHRWLCGHAAVSRRLDEPLRQPDSFATKYSGSSGAANLLVRGEGFQLSLFVCLGAWGPASLSLRPTDELRMVLPDAACHPQHCRHEPVARI